MDKSSELLKKYLSISEEILSLDFKIAFDKVENLIIQREDILLEMQKYNISEEDKKGICQKIIVLDKQILNRFNEEKDAIQKNIEKVKQERREQTNRKKAFNMYGEDKSSEKNVFFDKLK